MRNASLGVLVVIACGGTAVIDGGQGGDAGAGGNGQGAMGQGASAAGNPNGPNTTAGVTSGPTPACDTPGQCCVELCDAIEQLPCGQGECECDGLPRDRCEDSILALLQCVVGALPGSMVCSGTDVMIRCGVCEDEIDAVPSFCSGDIECAP